LVSVGLQESHPLNSIVVKLLPYLPSGKESIFYDVSGGKYSIITIFNKMMIESLKNYTHTHTHTHTQGSIQHRMLCFSLGWMSDSDTTAISDAGKQKTTCC
jgi:hypothetical protein